MPGTCGELVQGQADGLRFHVSCPIELYSVVTVTLTYGTPYIDAPPGKEKAKAAVAATLSYMVLSCGAMLSIESALPPGKGMASSTADVAGAVWATAQAAGRSLSTAEMARLAVSIEPTNGTLFPGLTLFDHREGKAVDLLGEPPPLAVLALDFGGTVDSVAFNQQDIAAQLAANEPATREALALLRDGLRRQDCGLIGRAATMSAQANQVILLKPQLDDVIAFARETGAYGVCAAHSGTVLGLLVSPEQDLAALEAQARAFLPSLQQAWRCRVIGGGRALPLPHPLYYRRGREAATVGRRGEGDLRRLHVRPHRPTL
ncbi:MAG: GHMP kinase [Chloroflexi bacterium]|nr:GHMP kinase [Chloroflexota bacterium]